MNYGESNSAHDQIKVMLVDDSAVVRGMISRIIEADPRIKVVNSVANGEMAVNSVEKYAPDILLLDIEMPVMDGITALPQILKKSPKTKVIMCSTLTEKGASISMKAMALGATEYLCKPSSVSGSGASSDFSQKLLDLVLTIGGASRIPVATQLKEEKQRNPSSTSAQLNIPKSSEHNTTTTKPVITTSNRIITKPECIAIGSSTGGPKALFSVISDFKRVNLPIALTQHMPATFTKILAQHIESQTGVKAVEAEDGMDFSKSVVHVAPGGFHMLFEKTGMGVKIRLNDGAPENFCKPAVDPMFRSLCNIYGGKIMGIILTGMGHDGLEGGKLLVSKGGALVAQDEATSVVWGMPGAVANAGICNAVLPLDQIGKWVTDRLG